MRRRLVGLSVVVLATALVASAPTGAQAGGPATKAIAEGSANDFRAVVTAVQGLPPVEEGSPPIAMANVEGFQRVGDKWTSVGQVKIGDDPWFWFVLTDIGGVCEFSVADTPRREVTVKLLVTPSVECAEVASYHVENGKLVEG